MEISLQFIVEILNKKNNPSFVKRSNRPGHFLSLDVETANAEAASICQIGMVEFENGQEINKWETLVDPEDYFDPLNVSIHGINEFSVKNAPRFQDIYPIIIKAVTGSVIVTHTTFDQTALRQAATNYGLPELDCIWLDSARVVRRQWDQFRNSGYGLTNVADFLGIKYKPHDALEDARTAGVIILKAIEQSNYSLEDWLEIAYKPMPRNNAIFEKINILPPNPDGPFYGETVVFTGKLAIERNKAAELAAELGCTVSNNITRNTTMLVVGMQDRDKLAGYEKSTKHRKAEDLIKTGQSIKILTGKDFIKMIEL